MANHKKDKAEAALKQVNEQRVGEVATSLSKVIASIGAIEKNRQSGSGSWGYAYRGIDDVFASLQPLLVEHNLFIVPKYSDFQMKQVTLKTKKGERDEFLVSLKLELTFCSTLDGSTMLPITTYGTGIDTGDKAVYKAKSGAYKYAILQALCIPTEEPKDAEISTPEVAVATLSDDLKLLKDAWVDKLASVKTADDLKNCREEMVKLDAGLKKELYEPYAKAKSRLS